MWERLLLSGQVNSVPACPSMHLAGHMSHSNGLFPAQMHGWLLVQGFSGRPTVRRISTQLCEVSLCWSQYLQPGTFATRELL